MTVHLSFSDRLPQRFGEQTGSPPPPGPPPVEEGLAAALQSIANIVEGQGGKVEPSVAR